MAREYPANAGDPMAINTEARLSMRSKWHEASAFNVQSSSDGCSWIVTYL